MRPLILIVTLLLLSCHVLGAKANEYQEDNDDTDDDDDDDEEMMSSSNSTKPCNTACILIFRPVCAINSRRVVRTFSNSCFLGVFNCQNREDFVAVANCSCIVDGITITTSTPRLPTKQAIKKEDDGDEDDD